MSAVCALHAKLAIDGHRAMEFLDARRLTGPNLLSNHPGSVLDIQCTPDQIEQVIRAWQWAVTSALKTLDWDEAIYTRPLEGGVSLAFSGPIDALYAATEINEWAWQCIVAEMNGKPSIEFRKIQDTINASLDGERNRALIQLQQTATNKGVTFLWDDDEVSLGLGQGSQTWPVTALPAQNSVEWDQYHDIPVGIVTGTNGKTTSARLASLILQGTGQSVGVSCTDWIAVNDKIIDRGDWSGPGGARNVLRNRAVSVAILETARGGLLRRGLGIGRANVALITNIAEDHLGDFGSRSLAELLDIKWVVSRAVVDNGTLILNADDKLLIEKARDYPGKITWFSLDNDSAVIKHHLACGGLAFILDGKYLLRVQGEDRDVIADVRDIPITLDGVARHNIANALGAAALTFELGACLEDIRSGLMHMSQTDNPGRCNIYNLGETKVLVDFAHNPHAMQALFEMARSLPAKRRLLAFGQAGDRPDSLIQELTRAAWTIGLDQVLVSELASYHRGRGHGEVYELIHAELIKAGARNDQIRHFEHEPDALSAALEWAQPGDLVIMLALRNRDVIIDRLEQLQK